jgi:flavin-dependent dehydrogenase
MKVAIMGAGMSGLSCAIALEKQGVTPSIFENRGCVGDRFVNAESMFHVFNSPVKDCLHYLNEEYGIALKPVAEVRKIVIHSKNETGSITGNIGYTNIRGRQSDSYEVQLSNQVKSRIEFNSKYEYEELCKNYDAVVLATGDSDYASHLGNFRNDLSCTVHGATIEGIFETDTPHVWFDYEVLPKGYGWVIPYSDKEANIVMLYPDYPSITKMDINEMWSKYYTLAEKDLNQSFRITDKFEVTRYMVGICNKPKLDNTYFVGNCFGAISPGLGFGQFTSILTGIYSALDICGLGKYEDLVKPLFANYDHSLIFRRFLENLKDTDLDLAVKNLNVKLIKQFIDKACNKDSKLQLLKDTTPLMAIFNQFKKSRE